MTEFREQNLTGARIRGALFTGSSLRGVELVDVEISGELRNVVVNGFRAAWATLERLWEGHPRACEDLPGSGRDLTSLEKES